MNNLDTRIQKHGINVDDLDLDGYIAFRGMGLEETLKTLAEKCLQKAEDTSNLMANDCEVFEYAFGEMTEEEQEQEEANIPKWCFSEGQNLTTDLENAKGYAESRQGYIGVFELSKTTDVQEFSDVYVQVRRPEEAKLVYIIHGQKALKIE
jgi:hypothetical protein